MTTNFHLGLPYHGSAQYTVTEEVKRRQTHYASERFSFGIRLLYIPECILINYQSLSKLAIMIITLTSLVRIYALVPDSNHQHQINK